MILFKKGLIDIKHFKSYYYLTKPGIVRGNIIAAIGGFLFASGREIDLRIGVSILFGTALVIASGCVLNNIFDANIDSKMQRTKKRAMVTGEITKNNAYIFATVLGLVGFSIIAVGTNFLALCLGLIALVSYVGVYTPLKKKTYFATFIGAVPGAIPPMAAYCSVSAKLDLPAILIFLNMFFWQLPHFFAISIFRIEEYKKASVPVMSIVKGVKFTKKVILAGIVLFTVISTALYFFGNASRSYLVVCLLIGIFWLLRAIQYLPKVNDTRWARKVFGISLMVLSIYSVTLALNVRLP